MAPVRASVQEVLGQTADADEDILEYIVNVLEDDGFEYGKDGEGIFDSVGMMLVPVLQVSGGFCEDDDQAEELCKALATKLKVGDVGKVDTGPQKLQGGPQAMGGGDTLDAFVTKKDPRTMIQSRFDNGPDLSVMNDKDAQKAAKRAEKDIKKAQAAAEAAAAEVMGHLQGNKPTIKRNQGGGVIKDVFLEQINVTNGGKNLVEDAELMLAFGRRYGLVGRNGTGAVTVAPGAGKTTFLRALAAGEIRGMPQHAEVLHVEQEVVGDDTPVLQAVLECDVERSELLAEEAALLASLDAAAGKEGATSEAGTTAAAERLQVVSSRLQEIGAEQAVAKAASILAGLSFDPAMQQRATKTFSGGWRMRVSLARALFVEPDILLLDEPTNHLDLHAVLWLEDYLLKWHRTVLLVSHAREFLNAVCTDIIHLHSRSLACYRGTYNNFVKTLNEKLRNEAKRAEALDAKKKHMQSFVDKFRFNAKRASLVQSRIKAIERLGDVQMMDRDPEYVFNFPFPDASITQDAVGFTDVSFNYPGGPSLFRNLSFGIALETRAAIVGPNGIGKSTLLNLISGGLEAVCGHINRNSAVRMATYSQHHMDGLALHLSPLQYFVHEFKNEKDERLRAHLSNFGISGDLAMQPMYTLSGGQKGRVAFAKVTFKQPHVLLLDEPSNHLDMDAVDALIEGLNAYKGGVLMVSHDQTLIEATMDELWMCEDNTINVFHGTFEDYKKRLRTR